MQTNAVATEKPSEGASNGSHSSKDPVLLGVSLPVSATVAAASQVKDAWAEALGALLTAAKTKANATKAKAANSNASDTEIKA
jgi:hypothetical protein